MKIYSISLKPAVDKAVDSHLVITSDNYFKAIAVDSCGGYIYWATDYEIERAAFDGSKREILVDGEVLLRPSLAIDHQTQKMYWIEIINKDRIYPLYIEYAELNGKNRRTLYSRKTENGASSLAISKDFIYWKSFNQKAILQLPKNQQLDVEPIVYSNSGLHALWYCHLTAANYTIMEQIQGTKTCEALKSLISNHPVSNTSDAELLKVRELNYDSTCQNYCFQGNCSVSAEGQPKCSCEAGYSGERCEVNACYMYCLHGGVCSLNEEDEPVCQCTADFEGERCNIAITHTTVCDNRTQQMLLDLRSAVKQYREELQCTLQLYSDKLDENAAKLQKCEESKKDDLQNHNENAPK